MSLALRLGGFLGGDPSEAESSDRSAEGVGWAGVLLTFAFWTLFGAVMTAAIFDSPIRRNTSAPWELVAFTFLGTYVWALLTLPLFALLRRIDLGSVHWGVALALLFAFGLATALLVSTGVSVAASFFMRRTFEGDLTTPEGIRRMIDYRYLNDAFACLLIFTAGLARDFHFRFRSRQEEASLLRSQLSDARVEVLRSQLDPHVLFNTLNAVAALVTTDPKGVRRMIASLSELLRFSLRHEGDPEISLEREIELTKHYLDIIEIRYQGQVRTSVSVDPGLLSAMVPSLVLQPLVENAMKHGMGPAGGRGKVSVSARRESDDLVLAVEDTGGGDGATPTPDAGVGLGLRLTEERLRLAYGDRGTVRLVRRPHGGTLAEVRLPLRHGDPKAPTANTAERLHV